MGDDGLDEAVQLVRTLEKHKATLDLIFFILAVRPICSVGIERVRTNRLVVSS